MATPDEPIRNGKIVSLHNLFTDVDEIDAFYK